MAEPAPPSYGAPKSEDARFPPPGQLDKGHLGPYIPQNEYPPPHQHPGPHYPHVPMQQPVTQQPMQMQQTNTTVVMVQQQQQEGLRYLRDWSTGICGCFEDPLSCCLVGFCPECFACHLANKAGESCCLPMCVPCWLMALRAHMRGKHGIQGSIGDDCCIIACCYTCALCQVSREIDNINSGFAPE